MKTTLDLPDDLFRLSKATAALRGETLKEFFTAALREHLGQKAVAESKARGWRAVFGKAPPGATAEVDAIINAEFEQINPDDWR